MQSELKEGEFITLNLMKKNKSSIVVHNMNTQEAEPEPEEGKFPSSKRIVWCKKVVSEEGEVHEIKEESELKSELEREIKSEEVEEKKKEKAEGDLEEIKRNEDIIWNDFPEVGDEEKQLTRIQLLKDPSSLLAQQTQILETYLFECKSSQELEKIPFINEVTSFVFINSTIYFIGFAYSPISAN